MASADDVTVRQCEPEEVKYLMEFSVQQDWDYSMYDYRSYIRLDPSYLLVAVDNSTGEPIGFGGLSLNGPDLYYLGNFIVREDHRNQGVGRKLWRAMLTKAGDKAIALDGAPEMVEWYKKNGFQFQSFKVHMHDVYLNDEMKQDVESKYMVLPLSEEDWPSLMEYDGLVFPNFDREKILKAWFTDDAVEVYIALKGGNVAGYGSIHKQTENAYALRNVYADNEEVLEEILRRMFANIPVGTKVRFWLMDDKHMPRYLNSADKSTDSARRLYNKSMIEANTDRMWLGTAHII